MKLTATATMRRALDARGALTSPAVATAKSPSALPPDPSRSAPAPRYERNKRTHELLRQCWPRLFSWAAPLAIGVDQHILDALGDQIDRGDLRAFLRWWTRRPAYRAALERGDRRAHLDLSDAGPAWIDKPPFDHRFRSRS